MEQRTYTVQEIDDLLRAAENKYLRGSYDPANSSTGRTCYNAERAKIVEEQVRAFMIAGITAEDLLKARKDS